MPTKKKAKTLTAVLEGQPQNSFTAFKKPHLDETNIPLITFSVVDKQDISISTKFMKNKLEAFDKIAKKALKEKLIHEKAILSGKDITTKKPEKSFISKIKLWITNKLFDLIYYLNK